MSGTTSKPRLNFTPISESGSRSLGTRTKGNGGNGDHPTRSPHEAARTMRESEKQGTPLSRALFALPNPATCQR
jgi:hypothetical protein